MLQVIKIKDTNYVLAIMESFYICFYILFDTGRLEKSRFNKI